jgi:hypothetical protein
MPWGRAPVTPVPHGEIDSTQARQRLPLRYKLLAIGSSAVLAASGFSWVYENVVEPNLNPAPLPAACSVFAGEGSTQEARDDSATLSGIAEYIYEHGGSGNILGAIERTAGNAAITSDSSNFGNTIMRADIPRQYCNPANLGHFAVEGPR